MASIYDFDAPAIDGKHVDFAQFQNQALLIVNTASKCGFTPQFAGLEALHQQYHKQGLTIIGFPCNQFGKQDPGNSDDIAEFCQNNYDVDFLMMQKVKVNGDQTHPIYAWLKSQKGGVVNRAIKWNFTKFLLGRDGQVIDRFAPTTRPDQLAATIETALY